MATFEELDRLSSGELHTRAVDLARHRLDLRFFWRLFESIPQARALAGELREGQDDIVRAYNWLFDYRKGGGELDEALRPVYLEYLIEHEVPGP